MKNQAFLRLKPLVLSVTMTVAGCQSMHFNQPHQTIRQAATHKTQHETTNSSANRNANYLIYIDRNGELLNPSNKEIFGRLRYSASEEKNYIDNIIENFKEQNTLWQNKHPNESLKLVIFIHGGLNAVRGANEKPDLFRELMLSEGYYPLFISWNSGPLTNYTDHMFRIRKGEANWKKATLSFPLVFTKDIARSGLNAPDAYIREIKKPFSTHTLKKLETTPDYQTLIAYLKETHFNILGSPAKSAASHHLQLQKLNVLLSPAKLITAPFVDGLGTGSWEAMLRRTDLVFTRPNQYDMLTPLEQIRKQVDEKRMALQSSSSSISMQSTTNSAFSTNLHLKADNQQKLDTAAAKFMKQWQAESSLNDIEITVVGHSMGTIVANNIIARYQDMNIRNLVFMGAAARIKDVENIVAPWLRNHQQSRFYSLSLDPAREVSESMGFNAVPSGSLLNWIDNTFGDVNSVKDKTAGTWLNMILFADDIFPNPNNAGLYRQRITLTKFAYGDAAQDGPQTHGGFDDYCFWRKEFWQGTEILQPLLEKEGSPTRICKAVY